MILSLYVRAEEEKVALTSEVHRAGTASVLENFTLGLPIYLLNRELYFEQSPGKIFI